MKYIKRLVILAIMLMGFSINITAQNDFNLTIISKEVKTVMGVQHQKLLVQMRWNGVTTNQQINYIGANPVTNKNISLVALDNFTSFDFSRGTLPGMIYNTQQRYPNQKIVAGVNGDFFDINSTMGQNGATAGPHIRDGKVVFQGYNYNNAYTVGVKVDGTPFMGKPTYDGYHIEVIDEDGSIKLKDLKVKINQLPGAGELAVLLPSFKNAAELTGQKMVIKTHETIIHRGPGQVELGRYFVEGKFQEIRSESMESIELDTMVLVGDDFFLDDLINPTDIVRLHNRPSGDLKGIWQGVSGNTLLIENGVVRTQTNKDVHPRTATGLKADGTIFFITVDGRQAPTYAGVTYEQLGNLLKYFGADKGFNLDGGGSTTVTVLDVPTDTYVVHNSPSDGNLRQDANGVGFIYGPRQMPLPPIPYPDTRQLLGQVSDILIDGNNLSFNPVENANRYVIDVDGTRIETTDSSLTLDVTPGLHDITIRAYGDHEVYRQSDKAPFVIETYSSSIQNIMDALSNYGKNTHQYLND